MVATLLDVLKVKDPSVTVVHLVVAEERGMPPAAIMMTIEDYAELVDKFPAWRNMVTAVCAHHDRGRGDNIKEDHTPRTVGVTHQQMVYLIMYLQGIVTQDALTLVATATRLGGCPEITQAAKEQNGKKLND